MIIEKIVSKCSNIFNLNSHSKNFTKDKRLLFLYKYKGGDYNTKTMYAKKTLQQLLKMYKDGVADSGTVVIECKYNGVMYPFYDLDNTEHYETFKEIFKDEPHIIINSSTGKFWGILDKPIIDKEGLDKALYSTLWRTCNDERYVVMANAKRKFLMRGMYESIRRKPVIVKENGKHSKNFSIFVKELKKFYGNEGLELSTLRYKTKELIIRFDRKRKLLKLSKK